MAGAGCRVGNKRTVIYVGIDDTDTRYSPGTNQLARALVADVFPRFRCIVAVRHQLLFDPRVPYTSKNSAASLLFLPERMVGSRSTTADECAGRASPLPAEIEALQAALGRGLRRRFVEGSDPGLCVASRVSPAIIAFGRRAQQEVVAQQEARQLAAAHAIHLEGLGGTEDGVIGALAAIGLACEGNDGRVVQIGNEPDDLAGAQTVETLKRRGVWRIVCLRSANEIAAGVVDVGKHLRPNYRGRRIVLFVEPVEAARSRTCEVAGAGTASALPGWRAVRLL